MHRSGTSALTYIFHLLGASLPNNILGANQENITGHWEPTRLVRLNDKILKELESNWASYNAISESSLKNEIREVYKYKIKNILKDEYSDNKLFVLKDPRMCRLLNLYLDVFEEMGVDVKIAFIFRNPISVCYSLARRNGMDSDTAQLLWARYISDSLSDTRSLKISFISYESLLSDRRGSIDRLIKKIKIKDFNLTDDTFKLIDNFLKDDLNHHEVNKIIDDNEYFFPSEMSRIYEKLIEIENLDLENSRINSQIDEISKNAKFFLNKNEKAAVFENHVSVDIKIKNQSGFLNTDSNIFSISDIGTSPELYHSSIQKELDNAFDKVWYLQTYQDVEAAGVDPEQHYLNYGKSEGRFPNSEARDKNYLNDKNITDISEYIPLNSEGLYASLNSICVNVIIPVYKGFSETVRCIESVIADPLRPNGDIIVIDDCSPDTKLKKWLEELSTKGAIRLFKNPVNVGFVKSVNCGIVISEKNDVVLLNSDTEVPNGWLLRLSNHAYSGKRVGTVTPFSNNATICSYPCIPGGKLLSGFSLKDLDNAFQASNHGRSIKIPTAVGFAMFIRRDCLNEVGKFDEETFGLGYGEENDFCIRATSMKWDHLLACDTFVYHVGEVSFGTESNSKKQAWKRLIEKYPHYPSEIASHVEKDPAASSRFSATLQLFRSGVRPVILIITHNLGGGTEVHVQQLISNLSDQLEFLILRPIENKVELTIPKIGDHQKIILSSSSLQDLVDILKSAGVSRAHIHHVMNYNMDIYKLINMLNIPFDFTVHDYYSICPQITMLNSNTNQFCNEPTEYYCNQCIINSNKHFARDIITWRNKHQWLLNNADRVICPSIDAKNRIEKFCNANHSIFIPHEKESKSKERFNIRNLGDDQNLRICILGTLAFHKGANLVSRMLEYLSSEKIKIILIGSSEPMISPKNPNFYYETGKYSDDNLQDLIEDNEPHLIWFPAPWPETYSYTLSAAIDSGYPIVATNIGAFTERLNSRPWTWLAEVTDDPSYWLKLFNEVRNFLTTGNSIIPNKSQRRINDFYQFEYLVKDKKKNKIENKRKNLNKIKKSSSRSVFVIPESNTDSSFSPCSYIRTILPMIQIHNNSNIDCHIGGIAEACQKLPDAFLVNRYINSDVRQIDQLLEYAKRNKVKIIYDLDDNLLQIPEDHAEYAQLKSKQGIVEKLLLASDVVTASTNQLADILRPWNNNVSVIQNGIDERILPFIPSNLVKREGVIRILYMGTFTHENDFKLVQPALNKILNHFKNTVQVDIIGIGNKLDLPNGFSRINIPQSVRQSYPAFISWLAGQRLWQIGIAPLVENDFNNCKSSIKALDYFALGLAVVASDVPAYRDIDKTAIILVQNDTNDWFRALAEIIIDESKRNKISISGNSLFLNKYTLRNQHQERLKFLTKSLV